MAHLIETLDFRSFTIFFAANFPIGAC